MMKFSHVFIQFLGEVTESIFSAPNFFCRGLLSDTHVNLSLAFQEAIAQCTV